MIKIRDKVNVPSEEKQFITPDARIEMFKNLVQNYDQFFSNFKPYTSYQRLHAYLNFNANIKADYLIIYRCTFKGRDTVAFDVPYLYTNRTTPAYRYVVKNNLYNDFFIDCYMHQTKMEYHMFKEFIQVALNLSFDKKSEFYWKDPKYGDILMENFMTLSTKFLPF